MTDQKSRALAILGGTPAFAEPVHVGRPNIGDRASFMARMEGVFDRRWLTNAGPLVAEFERRISDLTGARHCIATCNATIALEVSAQALGMRGEVIVPSFTFIATAHALQWQGITPVFCDIDPATHNIDPERVEELITQRTTGILGVHVWGRPCDTESLHDIAGRHGLALLFDAAHAFGASLGGRMIGTFGDAEVFSFHATKFVNSFEGGAITTNDDDLAVRIRQVQNFGFAGYDRVESLGTNGKMSEASAAMGLTSLEGMDAFIDCNRSNQRVYQQQLSEIAGITLLRYDPAERANHQYVVIEVDERSAGLSRDELLEVLWAENVLARRYFYPGCHRMEPYRSLMPDAGLGLPHTEAVAGRVLVLPNGSTIGNEAVEVICAIIHDAVESSAAVRGRLSERLREAPPYPWTVAR